MSTKKEGTGKNLPLQAHYSMPPHPAIPCQVSSPEYPDFVSPDNHMIRTEYLHR